MDPPQRFPIDQPGHRLQPQGIFAQGQRALATQIAIPQPVMGELASRAGVSSAAMESQSGHMQMEITTMIHQN